MCSSERHLHEEIKCRQSTFKKVNNYPKYVINKLNRQKKLNHMQTVNIERSAINQTAQNEQDKLHLLLLAYASNKEKRS